jgi:hypothetical protein
MLNDNFVAEILLCSLGIVCVADVGCAPSYIFYSRWRKACLLHKILF